MQRVELEGGRQASVQSIPASLAEGAWQRERGFGQQGSEAIRLAVCATVGAGGGGGLVQLLAGAAQPESRAQVDAPIGCTRGAGRTWRRWYRWRADSRCIDTCFESAKNDVGLDEYEVRSWTGWYRHVTLSLRSLPLLSAVRAADVVVVEKKRASLSSTVGLQGVASPDVVAASRLGSGRSFARGSGSECGGDTTYALAFGGAGVAWGRTRVGLVQVAAAQSMASPVLSLPATSDS